MNPPPNTLASISAAGTKMTDELRINWLLHRVFRVRLQHPWADWLRSTALVKSSWRRSRNQVHLHFVKLLGDWWPQIGGGDSAWRIPALQKDPGLFSVPEEQMRDQASPSRHSEIQAFQAKGRVYCCCISMAKPNTFGNMLLDATSWLGRGRFPDLPRVQSKLSLRGRIRKAAPTSNAQQKVQETKSQRAARWVQKKKLARTARSRSRYYVIRDDMLTVFCRNNPNWT